MCVAAGGGVVAVCVGTGVCEEGMGVRVCGTGVFVPLVLVAMGVGDIVGVLVKTAVFDGGTSVCVAVGGAG